uniref:ABC transporter domain-containing protein n=1 Tax=Arcella intermedia TaxID=1963864 RepID=A0A6B2KZP0_9EUKA
MIPSFWNRTVGHLISLTVLLWARTMLSLKVADIVGSNAEHIVQQNLNQIVLGVIKFTLIGIPASLVNSGLKYEVRMLSLLFRKSLTEHIQEQYLRKTNFYKASNLGGDSRIDNADQRVTQDIENFCNSLSDLYANLFKPILDVTLNFYKLSTTLGFRGPIFLFFYYALSASFKRLLMPSFGRLTARASELEGDYRTAHQRLIANSEEIAFYDGANREKNIISRLFQAVYHHATETNYLSYLTGIFDEFLVKYGSSITGYAVLALPVIEGRTGNRTAGDLTNEYVRNRQLLINLAKGVAQLIVLSNKVTSLAGLTARVSELLEMVNILDEAGSAPFKITSESTSESSSDEAHHHEIYEAEEKKFLVEWRERAERRRAARKSSNKPTVVNGGGTYFPGDMIKFNDVTLVNPDGKVLVEKLTFEVKRNCNVIVTGPNGSGKSSLFRVLGELWPLHHGTVTKPDNDCILFVPQKPYLVLGTLRDQIIYPHSEEEMKAQGATDKDLEHLLSLVDPSRTILNQWAWGDVRDWFNAFSGGQKQRVAMARLFYHTPIYGILDECTSAVSIEVEDRIYNTCKKLGITLFTVSHRPTLRKHHQFELNFNGEGGWSWLQIQEAYEDQ